ncbi:MAG: hypothetical protein NTX64_12745 [Elusimicrobia bacterium]|nr:hypothetical protein [Elusimicrobiota bacterium]
MKNLLSLAGALAFSVSMSQAAELPEASSLSAAQGFQRLADYRIVRIGSARDVSGVPAVPQAVYTEAQRSTSRPASVRFPKAPSRAGTGCYQSEKGCATISGFYISTKVALKKGGDCKQLSDLSGLCEDLKTKFPGSHAKSELPQMCRGVHDAVWQDFLYKQGSSFNTWQMEFATNLKAKLDLSEACCETVGQGCSWFADDIRIGYQQ